MAHRVLARAVEVALAPEEILMDRAALVLQCFLVIVYYPLHMELVD